MPTGRGMPAMGLHVVLDTCGSGCRRSGGRLIVAAAWSHANAPHTPIVTLGSSSSSGRLSPGAWGQAGEQPSGAEAISGDGALHRPAANNVKRYIDELTECVRFMPVGGTAPGSWCWSMSSSPPLRCSITRDSNSALTSRCRAFSM